MLNSFDHHYLNLCFQSQMIVFKLHFLFPIWFNCSQWTFFVSNRQCFQSMFPIYILPNFDQKFSGSELNQIVPLLHPQCVKTPKKYLLNAWSTHGEQERLSNRGKVEFTFRDFLVGMNVIIFETHCNLKDNFLNWLNFFRCIGYRQSKQPKVKSRPRKMFFFQ